MIITILTRNLSMMIMMDDYPFPRQPSIPLTPGVLAGLIPLTSCHPTRAVAERSDVYESKPLGPHASMMVVVIRARR
jgi:hypothetical protein